MAKCWEVRGFDRLESPGRRVFVQGSLAAAGSLVIGCSEDSGSARSPGSGGSAGSGGLAGAGGTAGAGGGCPNPFAGAELLAEVPFSNEGDVLLDTPLGAGLDGRLYTDLTLLSPDTLVTQSERFYIRTRYPDLLDPTAAWQISAGGLVDTPKLLSLADLDALKKPMGVHLLECSGNAGGGHFGLISAADWAGAPMADVLALVGVKPEATRVLISGFDEHSVASTHSVAGASWIFSLAELDAAGAFLALEMNGSTLPKDHGAPVRLFVPGWYGCSCIKWVNAITLVDESEPATGQMQEFAARTHQNGVPALAKDYVAAAIQQAAMPVRVEKWRAAGKLRYRVVGILWGGSKLTDRLEMSFGGGPWEPVNVCPPPASNTTWSLWEHAVDPAETGVHRIAMRVDDDSVPQIRLDLGWYEREIVVDEL